MATVDLRPGDTLNIVWTSVQETPLGSQEVESTFAFSYNELLERLQARGKSSKIKKVGPDGVKFSRIVALTANALKKGKWSTGADISKDDVFEKLLGRFEELAPSEYKNITSNARQSLVSMYHGRYVVKALQKEALKNILDKVGCEY